MASLILTATQKVHLGITPLDAFGNVAKVENVVWSTSSSDILTVEPDADGLGAWAVTTGRAGTARLQVVADALIGEGVEELVGLLDVEVVASKAVSLGIVAGVPEEK